MSRGVREFTGGTPQFATCNTARTACHRVNRSNTREVSKNGPISLRPLVPRVRRRTWRYPRHEFEFAAPQRLEHDHFALIHVAEFLARRVLQVRLVADDD